jgi:hypothetical protein
VPRQLFHPSYRGGQSCLKGWRVFDCPDAENGEMCASFPDTFACVAYHADGSLRHRRPCPMPTPTEVLEDSTQTSAPPREASTIWPLPTWVFPVGDGVTGADDFG